MANKARKSTGTRASTRVQGQKGPAGLNNASAQGDSSDSDVPTQPLRNRNHNSSMQVSSGSQADDNDQSTIRLSNGANQNSRRRNPIVESESDTTSDSDQGPGRVVISPKKSKKVPPPKKRRRRRQSSESEVEEEEQDQTVSSTSVSSTSVASSSVASSSVASSSVSSPNKTALLPRSKESLVNKCVYFFLVADQKKYPVKHADMLKHVFTAQERKCAAEVLKEADSVLKKTYGMEIVKSKKKKGEYMLINILSFDLGIQELVDYSTAELQRRGFIFYLLTIIFMNEMSIMEDELAAALIPLGVDLNARLAHPIFGDVRKYITTELVKQNYLEHKCISKDPPQYEITWGERAEQEVDKKDLLEFACKILNTRPEDWILQHNDAMAKRQETAE